MENLRKRIEIENLNGLNHASIAESDNESESSGVDGKLDKATFDQVEQNFKRSDFYFEQDESFSMPENTMRNQNLELMGE